MTVAPTAAPTPASLSDHRGVLCRIHVKGAGLFSTEPTDLDHAREIALHFVADMVAALEPDSILPLIPFPAAGNRVDLMVKAEEVSIIEVVRVDSFGRVR